MFFSTRIFPRYAGKALAATGILSVGVLVSTTTPSFDDTTNKSFCDSNKKKIVIVGGGTAGIGVAAMLGHECRNTNVTVVEPSSVHYYQPLWTLVGGGVKNNSQSVKPMKDIVPKGAEWVQKKVATFQPDKNAITLDDGSSLEYDYLVVAAGIQSNWDKVPGLVEGLKKEGSGVCSVYDFNYCAKTWREFSAIKDRPSTMLFTMPPTVIKCAGAPQKIMWLLEDTLRRSGLRDKADIQFWVPGASMFGIPFYAEKLEKLRKERDVVAVFRRDLVSIDVDRKEATFKNLDTNELLKKNYDLLHVAPHMSAPDFLKKSPLADENGWMAVDKETMQSTKYPNVFGIGDCTNTPNSKTAAAITSQAPVLIHNLQRLMEGKSLDGKYNGYASCPLIISKKRVLLAEFGYGGTIQETFSRKTGRFPYSLLGTEGYVPQRFFYFLKEQFFPFAYWRLWVHGWWYGIHGPFKPSEATLTGRKKGN